MDITEVQVKLIGNGDERLKASCTLVVDGEFVIRDVKVIEGTSGLFVAMPSRKLTDHCPRCSSKNHLRALFCNNCGAKLAENRSAPRGGNPNNSGAQQMHVEIAHPINSDCRQRLHERVIAAYEDALAQRGADLGADHDDGYAEPQRAQHAHHHDGPSARHTPKDVLATRQPGSGDDDFGAGLI